MLIKISLIRESGKLARIWQNYRQDYSISFSDWVWSSVAGFLVPPCSLAILRWEWWPFTAKVVHMQDTSHDLLTASSTHYCYVTQLSHPPWLPAPLRCRQPLIRFHGENGAGVRYFSSSQPEGWFHQRRLQCRQGQNDWSDVIATISAMVQTTSTDQCQSVSRPTRHNTIPPTHSTSQLACNSTENACKFDGHFLYLY